MVQPTSPVSSATHTDGRAGPTSEALFERARRAIPGGVNSPVRAFNAVGGHPPFIRSGEGAYLVTEDGARLIDYVGSWGPALFGHAPRFVVEAVRATCELGLSFGAPTRAEVEFAETLSSLVPALRGGKVRLVSSGTEATMSALRLARGYTGRDFIVKIDGGYHGHADMLLAAAGSGAATLGLPGSAGVPEAAVRGTLVVPFNDLPAMQEVFTRHEGQIAAIIVEPVPGNMGCVPPEAGYLQGLRELTQKAGALLIFDEVMSGFRVARGGAQELYGITPDLTCLGKIVGGGLPVGAYGGRSEIMDRIAPSGPVYQAGTLSGNPLAVAAGLATMQHLMAHDPYPGLEHASKRLGEGLAERAKAHGIALCVQRVGSMLTPFFQAGPVRTYADAKHSSTELFATFHRAMLARGVYLPASQFEAWFVSTVHTDAIVDTTLTAADAAFRELAGSA